ncbi:hypothetical protein HK102_011158, partial [Quaeritorhiza haematococci]
GGRQEGPSALVGDLHHAVFVLERVGEGGEVLRDRGLDADRLAGEGVDEAQGRGVERLAVEPDRELRPAATAVDRVADDRMLERRQVDADLVRPAGLQPHGDQAGDGPVALDHAEVGRRRDADAGLARDPPADHPGRELVDPVDDPDVGLLDPPLVDLIPPGAFQQGVALAKLRGLDEEPGGLVDDEDVAVLVQHGQPSLGQVGPGPVGVERQLVVGADLLGRVDPAHAPDVDLAALDRLARGASGELETLGHDLVEPYLHRSIAFHLGLPDREVFGSSRGQYSRSRPPGHTDLPRTLRRLDGRAGS